MTVANIGWSLFLIFIIYQNILSTQFNMPGIYGYWDELLFLIFVSIALFKWARVGNFKLRISNLKNIIPWIMLIFVGLIGNFLYGYAQTPQAIVRDIIGCMKFPIGFYAVKAIGIDYKIVNALKKNGVKWIKYFTIIIFLLGVMSLFFDIGLSQGSIRGGIHPYQFLFNHPTALVFASVIPICLLTSTERKNENFFYLAILSLTILLTMRTKGLAFVAVFIFMKYGGKWLKKVKILYWLGIGVVILAASYSQLMTYAAWTDSGREVLYVGAFELLAKCFPLGSGFGAYASHLSGRYRSGVYDFIYHYQFWNADGTATNVLGDTGYPYYIGQFGVIGIILIAYGVYRLLKANRISFRYDFSSILLLIYIGISLTSEAVLITYGTELGIILAITTRMNRMKTDG